jgi:hypothetical protein
MRKEAGEVGAEEDPRFSAASDQKRREDTAWRSGGSLPKRSPSHDKAITNVMFAPEASRRS